MKRYQTGSAHVIIIAVLVVALIGALVWIFWQNFVEQGDSTSVKKTTVTEQPVKPLPTTVEKCMTTEKLCFDIPSDWSADISVVPSSDRYPITHDTGTIKNTSGETILHVGTGVNGVGGSCGEDTKSFIDIYSSVPTGVSVEVQSDDTAYFSSKVYAVKATYNDPAKGSVPFVYLTNSKLESAVGKYTTCLPDLAALFTGKIPNSKVAFGNFIVGGDMPSYKSTASEAKQVLESADYMKAYDVLKSIRYQE